MSFFNERCQMLIFPRRSANINLQSDISFFSNDAISQYSFNRLRSTKKFPRSKEQRKIASYQRNPSNSSLLELVQIENLQVKDME